MRGAPDTPRNLSETAREQASDESGFATVLTVDPVRQVATVIDSRDSIHEEVPLQEAVGPDGEGFFGTPMPGWRATMNRDLGGIMSIHHLVPGPILFGSDTLKPEVDAYTKEINTFLALTGTPTVYRLLEGTQKNFRSHRPSDLIAGDWGYRTPEGATVYALRGGVAGIKASDLSQIIVNQIDDLVRVVSRNFDLFSDWGTIQLVNNSGKTALKVSGNAKGKDTHEGKFAYTLTIGDGENFIDLALLDKADGEPVYSFKVDQKGNLHHFLKKDQVEEINGNHAVGVTKSLKHIVGKNASYEVDGKHTLKVEESSVETIGTKKTIVSPKVHLGDEGGQKAPMGEDLVDYLKKLHDFWMQQAIITTPAGATIPGATLSTPYPPVPPLLSGTVDYIK